MNVNLRVRSAGTRIVIAYVLLGGAKVGGDEMDWSQGERDELEIKAN